MRIPLRPLSCAIVASVAVATGQALVSASGALAFSTSGVASFVSGSSASFSAGGSSQPAGDATLVFTDNSVTSVWSAGDSITFQLWDGTSNGPLSDTSSNSFDSAAFANVPTVAATNGVAPSAYTVTSALSGTSSVNDEFVLTFNLDAPKDGNVTSFIISGLSLTLGANVPRGHAVGLKATASNGTPFTGASATKTITLGSIPSVTVTNSQIATGAPSAVSIPLGNVIVTDVAGGAISSGDEIDFTLAYGAQFTTAGRIGGTLAAGTPTIVTSTTTADTAKAIAVKTSVVGDTVSLSGARITLPSTDGEVYIAVFDKTKSAFLGAGGAATVVSQTRIGGSDRYATARLLFDPQFSASTSAVLASGVNYPDALSAGYLAKEFNTGVLITDPGSLSTQTEQELIAHSVATVYLVGGTAAVSANVMSQVGALHVGNNPANPRINVIRIAGSDRFATNNLVDVYKELTPSTTAIVATGENFADALAVGPAIYKTGDPLILTSGSTLSTSARATIADLGVKNAVIVGGTSAVSSAVEAELVADGVVVEYRIAGADRTQTAADIAAWETGGLPASGPYSALGSLAFSDPGLVNVARGDTFADALVAGPVAGAEQHVIVLTADPNTVGAGIAQYFAGRAGTVATVQALGLAGAVSAGTLSGAAATLTKPLII